MICVYLDHNVVGNLLSSKVGKYETNLSKDCQGPMLSPNILQWDSTYKICLTFGIYIKVKKFLTKKLLLLL